MTGVTSAPRLSAAQVRAIRRAAQRQLTRWANVEPDDETRQRSSDLRHALQTLRAFRDGFELHPMDAGDVDAAARGRPAGADARSAPAR